VREHATHRAMKISQPDPKSTSALNPSSGLYSGSNEVTGVGPSKIASDSKPARQESAPDHVQLSSLSSSLSSALDGSPARLAKVSELSTAVSSGQYQVDAYAVSGSIIQHSIQFGGYMVST